MPCEDGGAGGLDTAGLADGFRGGLAPSFCDGGCFTGEDCDRS